MKKVIGKQSRLTVLWRLSSLMLLTLLVAACSGATDSDTTATDPPGEFALTAVEAVCTPAGIPGVTLSWSASEGADSYGLFRDGSSIADLDAATLDFTDSSGLATGTELEYMVRARNDGGTVDTTAVSVTVPAAICDDPGDGGPGAPKEPEPDAPPTGDVVLAVAARCSSWPEANLSWSPVTGAGGYQLHRDGTLIGEVAADTTTYTDSDVLIDTEHAWQLTAVNEHGSATGEPVNLTILPEDCGIAPTVISANGDSSLMVGVDLGVWAWGSNTFGQLGLGHASSELFPVRLPGLPEIESVSKGHLHGLGLTTDGALWGWGFASEDLLGIGASGAVMATEIPGLPVIRQAAAGGAHSLAVAEDGTVWAWGMNESGQLGQADSNIVTVATQVPGIEGAVQVFAGSNSSMALLADGRLLAWGSNMHGIIGLGSIAETHVPTELTGFGSLVVDVAFGETFSLVRTVAGEVYGFGHRRYLGIGASAGEQTTPLLLSDLPRISHLAAGSQHALAVLEDGSVIGWGNNPYRQLGPDTEVHLDPVTISGIGDAQAVAAGQSHSVILGRDGSVHALGANQSNQLGWNKPTRYDSYIVHTFDFPAIPEVIDGGTFHTLAVLEDGSVWAWGSNSHGQLGHPDLLSRYTPSEVPGLTGVVVNTVASGGNHSLALDSDGYVWSWGRNDDGALGLGDVQPRTGPVRLESLPEITAIAAGSVHSLALDIDGNVWVWGGNGSGQLGVSDTTSYSTPQKLTISDQPVSAITAGERHSVALVSGEVWSWGSREFGVIGDGGAVTGNQAVPVQVPEVADVAQIAAGNRHTVVVHSNGTATAWGRTMYGELGIGEVAGEFALPTDILGISGITEVFASNTFTLVRVGTDVHGWGGATALGLGSGNQDYIYSPRRLSVSGTARHVAGTRNNGSFVVNTDGQIYSTGNDLYGQLGMGRLFFSDQPRLIEDLPRAVGSD